MFIVFDLDGTLCDISHRLHHIQNGNTRWDRFYEDCYLDVPKWPIINTLTAFWDTGHHVEIWSGRSNSVRSLTKVWLDKHIGVPITLIMRPENDHTPDNDLKEKWLNDLEIKPDLIFEDRQRVVDMWRRNGIMCAQVSSWSEQ